MPPQTRGHREAKGDGSVGCWRDFQETGVGESRLRWSSGSGLPTGVSVNFFFEMATPLIRAPIPQVPMPCRTRIVMRTRCIYCMAMTGIDRHDQPGDFESVNSGLVETRSLSFQTELLIVGASSHNNFTSIQSQSSASWLTLQHHQLARRQQALHQPRQGRVRQRCHQYRVWTIATVALQTLQCR
jgi:hypothetical protein